MRFVLCPHCEERIPLEGEGPHRPFPCPVCGTLVPPDGSAPHQADGGPTRDQYLTAAPTIPTAAFPFPVHAQSMHLPSRQNASNIFVGRAPRRVNITLLLVTLLWLALVPGLPALTSCPP